MQFNGLPKRIRQSIACRVGLAMMGWLVFISGLHVWLNVESDTRPVVRMGYMPVITNLAAPLLDYTTRDNAGVRFKAVKFAAFAEIAEALRHGQIEAAFMIAPLAIVLRQQGEAVKVVYIGNRHESTLVIRADLKVTDASMLAGKTIAVPMRYSGHCLSLLQLMEKYGLDDRVKLVEMNPPDMASALAVGSLDGYFVGEPFAALSVKNGDARVLHYVEDLWPNFICNLVLVKQSFIESHPDRVATLVESAVRSGIWAENNTAQAARIAARYWNQPSELVEYALTHPKNRIRYDRFLPRPEELQHMADLMVHFGLTESNDIGGLVEDRFCRRADRDNVAGLESIVRSPAGRQTVRLSLTGTARRQRSTPLP
jgi:NitT/TauT family transport system substrate-binding protein